MISIVCPVYNEERYITRLLEFLLAVEPAEKELIFIDGGSTDATRDILMKFAAEHKHVVVLDNPKRFVPFALNLALEKVTGNPVIRIDAHSEYAPDYFVKILETFEKTGADIVGGPVRMKWQTEFQRQVAGAMQSSFGTGNSEMYDESLTGECDHVTFGAWQRKVFDATGRFDERLLRNQDEEFHYRAKSRGMRIYRNPEIKLWYYPRDSVKGLFRQFYEYGLFKPLVLLKMKQNIRLRHLVPALFVLYISALAAAAVLMPEYILLAAVPGMLYMLIAFLLGLRLSRGGRLMLKTFLIYPAIHTGYGAGFLKGLALRLFASDSSQSGG